MSNTMLREAARLNECEALGLQVSRNRVLEVSTSTSSVPLPQAGGGMESGSTSSPLC